MILSEPAQNTDWCSFSYNSFPVYFVFRIYALFTVNRLVFGTLFSQNACYVRVSFINSTIFSHFIFLGRLSKKPNVILFRIHISHPALFQSIYIILAMSFMLSSITVLPLSSFSHSWGISP